MPRAKASLLAMMTTALTVAVLFLLPYTPTRVVQTMVAQKGEWMRSALLSGVVGYEKEQMCVAAQAGRISKVYVQPGQQVQEGDLLFLMDTSIWQQTLFAIQKARYEQRQFLSDGSVAALAMQQELQWQQSEQEARQAIALAQIRAQMDGTVAAVYVAEGSYVEMASLLGNVHNGDKCVKAMGRMDVVDKAGVGAPAALNRDGKALGAATIASLQAPSADDGGMQQLTLLPLSQEQLSTCETGQEVTVELLLETISDRVLIPLSAVDAKGRVWYVRNGMACSQTMDVTRRNGENIAAGSEWEGRQIILSPNGLYEGCPVKEAKM